MSDVDLSTEEINSILTDLNPIPLESNVQSTPSSLPGNNSSPLNQVSLVSLNRFNDNSL